MNVQDNFQAFCNQVCNLGPYDRITFSSKNAPVIVSVQRTAKRWHTDSSAVVQNLEAYFCNAIKIADREALSIKALTFISSHYRESRDCEAAEKIDAIIKKIENALLVKAKCEENGKTAVKCRDGTILISAAFLKQLTRKKSVDFLLYPQSAIAETISLIKSRETTIKLSDLLWVYSLANDLKLVRVRLEAIKKLKLLIHNKPNVFVEALRVYFEQLLTYEDFKKCPLNAVFQQYLYLQEIDWSNVFLHRLKQLSILLMICSERDIPSAFFYLGKFSLEGIGCKKNGPLAIECLEKSYALGDLSALFLLGYCYFTGDGVERCLNTAEALFKKAVARNCVPAIYSLGLIYQNKEKENLPLAFEMFMLAAEKKYLPACAEVGICYYNGLGVEENVDEGIHWLLQAANRGFMPAKYYVGLIFKAVQPYDAFLLLKDAADHGHLLARKEVAQMYSEGVGIPRNQGLADKYSKNVD